MTLKELKDKLNTIPIDFDNYEVCGMFNDYEVKDDFKDVEVSILMYANQISLGIKR